MRPTNVTQELMDLENRYWQAIKENDVDTVGKLTDDPCIVAGAQGVGVLNKKQLLSMLEKPTYRLEDFDLSEPEVRLLSDDVAIVAYKVREALTVKGKPLTLDAADASTWVKRGGRWLCALHTESVSGDPFGRDRHRSEGDVDAE